MGSVVLVILMLTLIGRLAMLALRDRSDEQDGPA